MNNNHINSVHVIASGFVTPLGDNGKMICNAFEAGISPISETSFLNKRLIPIKMVNVPVDALPILPPEIEKKVSGNWHQRLLRLGMKSLSALTPQLKNLPPLPLFLSLPEAMPRYRANLSGHIPGQIAQLAKLSIDTKNSRTLHTGRAGSLEVFELAMRYFEAKKDANYAIVGGVDSHWDPNLLARLDADNRLLVAGAPDGSIPGESGTMLLICREAVANQHTSTLLVKPPGKATETEHRYSENPNLGVGLDQAVKQALANAHGTKMNKIWTTHLYDMFCTKELQVTAVRNHARFSENCEFIHPAEALGDIGAAFGPTILGMIHAQITQNTGEHHLICCSSDLQARTAAVCRS